MERPKKSLSLKQPRDKQDNGLSKKGNENNEREDRFVFDVMIDDLAKFKEGETPANTEKNTELVCRNFELWRIAQNNKCPDDQCPKDVLRTAEDKILCE